LSCFHVIDGKANAWLSCLYSKQVFGPRTAKSQPIWIILCTHLCVRNSFFLSSFFICSTQHKNNDNNCTK